MSVGKVTGNKGKGKVGVKRKVQEERVKCVCVVESESVRGSGEQVRRQHR